MGEECEEERSRCWGGGAGLSGYVIIFYTGERGGGRESSLVAHPCLVWGRGILSLSGTDCFGAYLLHSGFEDYGTCLLGIDEKDGHFGTSQGVGGFYYCSSDPQEGKWGILLAG